MTWHVLHAGKFVDADGVVLDRAEHEFIGASGAFPDAARRLIARQDPVARQTPVAWKEGFYGALVQTAVRIDGVDYTLRVLDHRAFEGPADRPGRPYRRRTYLIQPCDDWSSADAALPIDAMAEVPDFQGPGIVEPWQPKDQAVAPKLLAGDLGAVLSGPHRIVETPSANSARRLSAVLAVLPAAVAARMPLAIGGDAALSLVPEGNATAVAGEKGQPWLDVLLNRGAKPRLTSLAQAAQGWRHATPTFDALRPFDAIRAPLGWAMQVEAWCVSSEHALTNGKCVLAPPVEPSLGALRAILAVLQQQQAFDRLGPLADGTWTSAWAAIEADAPWDAVAALLAGKPLSDKWLDALTGLDFQGEAAAACIAAWIDHLPNAGDGPLRALLTTRTGWAKALRGEHRGGVAARVLVGLTDHPDAAHPFWRLNEGLALQALLDGTADARQLALIVPLPAENFIARNGDLPANAAWMQAGGRPGEPGDRQDAVVDCLGLLRGVPIRNPATLAAHWPAMQRPLPVAAALRLGALPEHLEPLLDDAEWERPGEIVRALLCSRTFDANRWLAAAGREGPWRLLHAEPGSQPNKHEEALLTSIHGVAVANAARHHAGHHPAAWKEVPASELLAWLETGGVPDGLLPLLPTAPVSVLAAWTAWARKAQRPEAHVQAMIERHMAERGWLEKRAIRKAVQEIS